MNKPFIVFLLSQTLLIQVADAQINATLSRDTLNIGESLQLSYEVIDSPSSSPPDLSPMEREFNILHRSVRHSTRSFNGRTTQRTTLDLTLMPRTSGQLRIPPVQFGQESSRSLSVTVLPERTMDDGDTLGSPPEQPVESFSPWQQPYGMPNWLPLPDIPDRQGNSYGMPNWLPNPVADEVDSSSPAPEPMPKTSEDNSDLWFWIAMLALAGWTVSTLLLLRLLPKQKGLKSSKKKTLTETSTPQSTPAVDHIAEIKEAYRRNEPFSAKDALLAWASVKWEEEPPTNLSRLAARCEPQLQRQILKLEEAIYSPEPVVWNHEAVWEHLGPSADIDKQVGAAPKEKRSKNSEAMAGESQQHYY